MNAPDPNHIGYRTWKRLSPGQKRAIIKNRQKARKLATEFIKQKDTP